MKEYEYKSNLPLALLIVFIVFLIMVILGGFYYYTTREKKILYDKQVELFAISSLKIDEIVKWRKERVSDADVIYNNKPLINQIFRFYKDRTDPEIKGDLITWMQSLIRNFDYRAVFLLDSAGDLMFSYPEDDTLIDNDLESKISEAYTYNSISFTDLHTTKTYPEQHIDMIVPLTLDGGETYFGTVSLRIDPEILLFPIVESWPTHSETSETFLIRREGDSIIYLNKPANRGDPAANLKLPLGLNSLPSEKVIAGYEGGFEGIDYRNVPVIANLRKIPGTTWFVMAKVDKKEIFEPFKNQVFLILIIVILLVSGAFSILRYYLRNQDIAYLRNLRRLSARHEAILAAVPNIIMEVDNNNIYQWANKPGYDFFGTDVIGRHISYYSEGVQPDLMIPGPSFQGDSNKRYFENWQRRKDGIKRLLSWWSQVLRDEGDKIKGMLLSGYDITELFIAEEELKNNARQMKELNATKDKFFSIITHDLKSPFTSIIGFSELLSGKIKNKDFTGIEDYALNINKSSWYAMDLLKNLTEWSKLQTGRIKFNPVKFNLVPLIREIMVLHECQSKKKSIEIRVSLSDPFRICADISMMSIILRNLISNAVKFTNHGGAVNISATEKEDEFMIVVSDNGIGIPPDILEKLFRIDESISTYGTENEEGTGLGLILCKEFVDCHGGMIWVESEVNRGSKFYFTVPARHCK